MTELFLTPPYLQNRLVTVLGLGSFGGGVGAVKYLTSCGAKVTVVDQSSADQLTEMLTELEHLPDIEFLLGPDTAPNYSAAELIVINPAVKPTHPVWEIAREQNIPFTSEIGLFIQATPAKIIGVTGSNGKSTTAALIASMIREEFGQCWLGGNLGGSLLAELDKMIDNDWCVLELSSFQLHTLDQMQFRPDVAVVTNFSPNHLDWHQTLEHYRESKQSLLRHQQADQITVLNKEDPELSQWSTKGVLHWFDSDKPLFPCPSLTGPHNQENINAAITVAQSTGVSEQSIQRALQKFKSLPHRLEYLGEIEGRKFYNDSLATTPESAIAALHSFHEPVILLAGGADKQVDLQPLAQEISQQSKATVLMGETAPQLQTMLNSCSDTSLSEIAEDFPQAFRLAWDYSEPGEIILLSPGCASYGWFQNFKDRGNQFQDLFEQLQQKPVIT